MRKKTILGVDPGKTTGLCVIDENYEPVFHDEAQLEELVVRLRRIISIHDPQSVVIESVVASGLLNPDKVAQIKAFDRVSCVLEDYNPDIYEVYPPEVTKKSRHPVPTSVRGNHAKDAYRLAAARLTIIKAGSFHP